MRSELKLLLTNPIETQPFLPPALGQLLEHYLLIKP
jgi:hypothetical protein